MSIGALPCFCFSHSSECRSSSNHYDVNIESNLLAGNDDAWSVIDGMNEPFNFGYDASNGNGLFVYAQNKEVWFNAPSKWKSFIPLFFYDEMYLSIISTFQLFL